MKIIYLFLILLIPFNFAFAQSSTLSNYELIVDDHILNIPYTVDADVLAMAIDQELFSLLIGLENTKDSEFLITLNNKIISAENNDFLILVNGVETDYEIQTNDKNFSLYFFVPEFTEEVEIVGTHVIPEFPLGVILILITMMSIIIIFTKSKLVFRL